MTADWHMTALKVKASSLILIAAFFVVTTACPALAFDVSAVNEAQYEGGYVDEVSGDEPSPLVVKLQILLDRKHYSPGIIDGRMGDNTVHALREFEERSNLASDGQLDGEVWKALEANKPKALVTYSLTKEDLEGPFVESIPDDYAAMAKMDQLSYTSVEELLSEKFHITAKLLHAMNPNAQFDRAGEEILVPNVADTAPDGKVKSIEVDKSHGVLRGFANSGEILVVYPATIGSEDNPTPSGTMSVKGISNNPKYSYRPDKNFQQGENEDPLTLPPGPNGPVGSIWIDLTKETYGIHGTADPELIGKSGSHGCVRLTNWDAEELGKIVGFGAKVRFLE